MKKHKNIIILTVIIFVLCIAYSFYFKIEPTGDEEAYDNMAQNFLNGHGFVEWLQIAPEQDRAICFVGQGYVLFLAGIYKIFGHQQSMVWIFQSLLHAVTSLLLFFICLKIFKNENASKIGLLAMGFYGFWPDLIESTAMFLTEPLFLFLTVLAIYLLIRFFQDPNYKKIFILSLVIGLGASVRQTMMVFILVAIVFLFIYKLQKKYICALILILVPTIILIGFMYRNYLQFHRFVLTTAGGYDLWVGNHPNANGEFEPSQEIKDYIEQYGFRNIDKKGISEVKNFILTQPLKFLKLQLIKTSKYFSLIRPTGWWHHLNILDKIITLLLSGIFGAIGFIFGISGMIYLWKEKDNIYKLLISLAIISPIPVILIVVGTRYRYQIYPFLAIFAAYYLIKLFTEKQNILYKIPLMIFTILILNSIYDLITNFNVFLEHLQRIV
jgi:hypothetical protein